MSQTFLLESQVLLRYRFNSVYECLIDYYGEKTRCDTLKEIRKDIRVIHISEIGEWHPEG